jgi:hypothetical protein
MIRADGFRSAGVLLCSRGQALGLLCLLGAVSSVAALVIGFIPPSQFGHSNPLTYAVLILAGILAVDILPPLLMDRLRNPAGRQPAIGLPPSYSQARRARASWKVRARVTPAQIGRISRRLVTRSGPKLQRREPARRCTIRRSQRSS